ncbi:hypothetical protein EDB81DRAFT_758454 [Dactylonectria macrodidyma]|uniref:C2H2-type domain-containing protein n=1 Tax=Dactylonectria macrodidyma TaxID=307937 RepID=A0A9P9JC94_9HYPO|nr:hypothetical protein EDB81DRAFT_758454 [Dactylonectria macrodidyma]
MGTNPTRAPKEYIIVRVSKKTSNSRTDGEGNDITETSSSQDFPSATAPTTETMGDKPKLKVVPVTTKISRSGPGLYLHKCDECPEAFPGAEHLRLRCPWTGCYESFDHRHLLEGHLRRHEEYDDAEVRDTLFAANMRQASTRSMPEMRATPSLQTQAAYFTPQPHLEQIGDEHGYQCTRRRNSSIPKAISVSRAELLLL